MLLAQKQSSCQTRTKQSLCIQNNALVDKAMLMPTKQCSRRHHNAPVDMLLSINYAPVDIAWFLSTKTCSCRPNHAPAIKTIQKRPLTIAGSQKRHLRSLGHNLKAVVQIGQHGITAGVIQAIRDALSQHELIKVSINGESPTERKSGAEQLASATGSHLIQVIGRVIVLYRRGEDEQAKVPLPRVKKNK